MMDLPALPPLDPNNLMGSLILQWQAMGLPVPNLDGIFAGPNNNSHTNNPHWRTNSQRRKRCRDFDTKGICAQGQACPFDHGSDMLFYPSSSQSEGRSHSGDAGWSFG
jgi:hypothetical protein